MDPLTQGLLGAVTAELGFRQRIGPRATLMAFGAAMTPDLDLLAGRLLSMAGGPDGYDAMVRIHRGPTHSIFMVPFIALAIALLWWLVRRLALSRRPAEAEPRKLPSGGPPKVTFLLLYACIFVAVLTHGLLDWCTAYGTQILWPLSRQRYALDIMPIIDIFYTPILLLTVLCCWLVRKRRPAAGRAAIAVGWVGFVLSLCYVAGGWIAHDRAVSLARAMADRKVDILRVDAYPSLGTIFLWRSLIEGRDRWIVRRIHLFAPITSEGAPSTTVTKQGENEWVRRARTLKRVKQFEWFSMGRMRGEYTKTNRMHVVEFHDMRYGVSPKDAKSLWSVQVKFDESGSVISARRIHNTDVRDRMRLIVRLWRDIWNP